jgi:hypothetical protein
MERHEAGAHTFGDGNYACLTCDEPIECAEAVDVEMDGEPERGAYVRQIVHVRCEGEQE